MRVLALTIACAVLNAAPAFAEFPAALELRLKQGVQACTDYYLKGSSLSALQRNGFAFKGKVASLTLSPPETSRKTKILVFTEGVGDDECEVHANYTRHSAQKDAFNLTLATMQQNGFTRLRKHHYSSKAKTIYEKGNDSVFHLIRVKQGRTMIKFRRRSP